MNSYLAPSGLNFRFLGHEDVEYEWRQVFEKGAYAQHGISLKAGDNVIDGYGGFGLFACYAAEKVGAGPTSGPEGKVISCEPLPETFKLLKMNVQAHANFSATAGRGSDFAKVTPLQTGLSDGKKSAAIFHFYKNFPGLSTMSPDPEQTEAEMLGLMNAPDSSIRPSMLSMLQSILPKPLFDFIARWYVRTIVLGQPEKVTCQLTTVSDIMDQHKLASVQLLRVAAPQAELDVLHGVRAGDWPKVKQVVAEVADNTRLEAARKFLKGVGFSTFHVADSAAHRRLYATRL